MSPISKFVKPLNQFHWFQELKRAYSRARWQYDNTPRLVRNWRMWALRRALMPYVYLPCVVTTIWGVRYWLGRDPVDDRIMRHLMSGGGDLYFPSDHSLKKAPELILDVGAHHGFYLVEALRRFPEAHAIAVEPSQKAIAYLKRNLRLNGMQSRVRVVRAAVHDRDGTVFLEESSDGSWGDTIFGDGGIPVPALSVKTLLMGQLPDIVKSNSEGGEYTLVPGLLGLGLRPELMVLMLHPEHGDMNALLASLRAVGYRVQRAPEVEGYICFHCFGNSA